MDNNKFRIPGKFNTLLNLLFLIFLWSIINSSACPGNGPYPYNDTGRIDTTQIRELEQPLTINMQVSVSEFDFTIHESVPVESAAVHYFNADTTIYSDSNGYTNASFLTYTTPYKYSYEISKEGFVSASGSNWDTVTTIIRGRRLERVQ
ncbi:MAG: hypothetical protein GX556_15530 [Fibrobacter sp.]|mgnify:CR=1 FL=1|nr:hypothetical protein [Fibrobacter sp.]